MVSAVIGSRTDDDSITHTAPWSDAVSSGSAARSSRIADQKVMSSARCQISSVSSVKRPGGGPPMLTSSRSRPPSAVAADDTARAGPSSVARSTGIPTAPSEVAVAVSRSDARAATATRAPSSVSARATAAPNSRRSGGYQRASAVQAKVHPGTLAPPMRRLLLWMAANQWLRRRVPKFWFARRAVRRFMPGESPDAALDAAARYQKKGIAQVFTRLGENLTRLEEAQQTADAYLALMDDAARRRLDAEMSVKLTQLGFDIDADRTLDHMRTLAARAHELGHSVWIDMEGSAYTDQTLELYEKLKAEHANAGICLQAYLKRTYTDVDRLLPLSPRIRLVKGAYAEPPVIAYQARKEVDANYLALCVSMLAHVKAGRDLFLGLGTHDVRLIEQVADHAQSIGLDKDAFDVEMLYGIRTKEQERLLRDGFRVRVLIAYGDYWYPWYMRRLAERPANVIFALRQLLP